MIQEKWTCKHLPTSPNRWITLNEININNKTSRYILFRRK